MNTKHKTSTSILLLLMATVFASERASYGQSSLTANHLIAENDQTVLSMLPLFSAEPEFYAQSSRTDLLGVYRFETRQEFNDFWLRGGHLITETDGKVFTSDFAPSMAIGIYDTQDGEMLTWEFIRPGPGDPGDRVRATYTTWYDLETDCWVNSIHCGDPENPYLMNARWNVAMVIDSSDIPGIAGNDPPGIWTIRFLKNGDLVYSEQFELVPVPKLAIEKAMMVSPNELGIGLKVEYPDYPDYEGRPLYLRFSATINGMPIEPNIPVDGFIPLGEVWGEGPVLDPRTCIKINLNDWEPNSDTDNPVPKFAQNQNFQLTGVAYCPNIEPHLKSKEQPPVDVNIPLPVVILHGYIDPFGYPFPFLGGDVIAYTAYRGLSNYLVTNGYNHEDTWAVDSSPKYRTLWDPEPGAVPMYTNPRLASPAIIEADLDRLLGDIWRQNYARKVDLVGHSFGGLVARYYAAVKSENVNKVITVGAPHKGMGFFFEKAFSVSKAAFESECPESSPLRWGVPTYPCTYQKIKKTLIYVVPFSIVNTLTTEQGSGVRYWSIYNSYYKRTRDSMLVVPTANWCEMDRYYLYSPGDNDVLIESAGGFGTPIEVESRQKHATLCKDGVVQTEILRVLRQE